MNRNSTVSNPSNTPNAPEPDLAGQRVRVTRCTGAHNHVPEEPACVKSLVGQVVAVPEHPELVARFSSNVRTYVVPVNGGVRYLRAEECVILNHP